MEMKLTLNFREWEKKKIKAQVAVYNKTLYSDNHYSTCNYVQLSQTVMLK